MMYNTMAYVQLKPIEVKRPQRPALMKKNLTGYFKERIEHKVDPLKSYYESVYYAPSTEFTLARHEINCLDSQLVTLRNQWVAEKATLNKRWTKARLLNQELQQHIPHLNAYYKESFVQRDRSKRLQHSHQDQTKLKDVEIRRLEKENNKLQEILDHSTERLEKFSVFKIYLERTKECSQGEFQDIRELIDRYGVLSLARDFLKERNDTCIDNVAKKQKALDDDILMKSNEVLAYRNYLSELLEFENTLQDQVFRLTDSLLRIKTTAAQRTLIIGQIKLSINNLYLVICRHLRHHPKLRSDDVIGQCHHMAASIKEMSILGRDVKRMLRAAHYTAEAEKIARAKMQQYLDEKQKRADRLANKTTFDVNEVFNITAKQPIKDAYGQPIFKN